MTNVMPPGNVDVGTVCTDNTVLGSGREKFIDEDHADWELFLQDYLLKWPKTLLVVSHARDFLNAVCTDVIHLHNAKLVNYRGNYDVFEKTASERHRNAKKAAEGQERQKKHMQASCLLPGLGPVFLSLLAGCLLCGDAGGSASASTVETQATGRSLCGGSQVWVWPLEAQLWLQAFVDKFRYNAKRASLVQSRIKAIERLGETALIEDDPEYVFKCAVLFM